MSVETIEPNRFAADGSNHPTRIPQNRMRYGSGTESEYKPRHVRWPGDKNPAQPWPERYGKTTFQTPDVMDQASEAWLNPNATALDFDTSLPPDPNYSPITTETSNDFELDILKVEIPLDPVPVLNRGPKAPTTRAPAPFISYDKKYRNKPSSLISGSRPSSIAIKRKGMFRTLIDPQEGLPILGTLSFVPIAGIPFGIGAIVMGSKKKNRPLSKRSEKGFGAAGVGLGLQGMGISFWVASFAWKWAMNDIGTLYELLM